MQASRVVKTLGSSATVYWMAPYLYINTKILLIWSASYRGTAGAKKVAAETLSHMISTLQTFQTMFPIALPYIGLIKALQLFSSGHTVLLVEAEYNSK